MSNVEQVKTASGLNVLAGIWLVASSYIMEMTNMAMSSNLFVVGIVVAIVGLIRVSMPESTAGLSWLSFILGIWLVISSFVMTGITPSVFWNSLIMGIVIAGLAYWSTTSAHRLQMR